MGYLSERDDEFDPTYATFRFVPDQAMLKRQVLPNFTGPAYDGEVDTDARWRDAIARVEHGDITPGQIAGFDQLITEINNRMSGGGIIRI